MQCSGNQAYIHSSHACRCLERETVFSSVMMDPRGLFFTLKSFCEDVKNSASAFMTFKLQLFYVISFSTDISSIITPYSFIFTFATFTFPLLLALLNSLNFSSVPGLVWFNDYNNISESYFLWSRRTHSWVTFGSLLNCRQENELSPLPVWPTERLALLE